ncbi:hypothetical protein [Thalassobacillus hwangdonensis]|uniref:Lipoprotein n=1 Tax=Thalassobacillus hwangdonensis TaxID=546108 RepID=A0ABW3L0H0_9BACI
MSRKMISLLLLCVVMLLSACNTKTFTYSGETEEWAAELEVIQDSNDYETQNLTLEYTGDDVSSVGEITYNVESVGGFGESGVTLGENGKITGGSKANPTNAKVSEHTEVEISVEWNGNTETFELNKSR